MVDRMPRASIIALKTFYFLWAHRSGRVKNWRQIPQPRTVFIQMITCTGISLTDSCVCMPGGGGLNLPVCL